MLLLVAAVSILGGGLSQASTAAAATVAATPLGVPVPSGGWAVEYADGFGEPLGTGAGHDNSLIPTSYPTYGCNENAPPFHSNEMEVFNCSATSVDANGLELSCRYSPSVGFFYGTTQNYTCGAATSRATAPPGYKFFQWEAGGGHEWAFQIVARFPPNTGEADPGFWSPTQNGGTEIDFFEAFGHEAGRGGTWCTTGSGSNGYIGTVLPAVVHSVYAELSICRDLGFDPSAGFHTYTSVMFPDNMLSEYVDGKLVSWTYVPNAGSAHTSTVIGPSTYVSAFLGLELSYPLRNQADGNPDPYFESGVRTMTVRSVSVYENATADDADTLNPQIAPGTSVG
jgi:hypothetical protein